MAFFPQAVIRPLRSFKRDEEGSLVIFSLFMFICMIMIAGIAVDVMRYENVRVKTQNTIDRAVLAAADLDQTVDPKVVVDDYFAKAGMDILDYEVDVTETKVGDTLTSRKVTANSTVDMGTMFMHMMGVESLSANSISSAEESINNIEISLILDVSGSMGRNNKLTNMQDAAKDFIDEIFENTEPDRVSISLIPYSTQVNAGAELLQQFNATDEHTYSHCAEFVDDDFNSTAMSTTDELQRAGHFDPWGWYNRGREPSYRVCRTDDAFEITPWSNDVIALKNQIEDFYASGNTSIDVAVKWGSALLDPSLQPVLTAMAGDEVPNAFIGRPSAHNDEDTLKFMVVMTDGINTTQYYLKNGYRDGPSPVFIDIDDGDVSMGVDTDDDGTFDTYWWATDDDDKRTFQAAPDGGSDNDAIRMSWPEVWNAMSLSWHAYYNHYAQTWDADDYYDNFYAPRGGVSASKKDQRLSTVCSAARTNGMVIFAIGFEVTDYSAGVMRNCASSDNHFYRVEGLEIGYAFKSIANQINQLKLTQ